MIVRPLTTSPVIVTVAVALTPFRECDSPDSVSAEAVKDTADPPDVLESWKVLPDLLIT